MTTYLSDLRDADSEINFHCTRVALEAAVYLFQTDKAEEGAALLAEYMDGDESRSTAFLKDIAAEKKYEVKAYFDRHGNHNAVGYETKILVGEKSNYLVRRIFSVTEDREVLHIQGLPSEWRATRFISFCRSKREKGKVRPAELIGQSIDRYHIIEIIGEGGMAVVYKAFDKRLESEVAFKLLRTEMLTVESQKTILDRFEFEAKALAKLNHPNIVSVIDYGDYRGTPWLVMKYMEGGTVKQFIGKVMSPPEAARLLAPIASALAYAHSKDIIHRDVKPSNILVSQAGFPMLSDFGIAKIVAKQDFKLTQMGISIGTPEYMAPEQAKGRVTKLSDQYSLGLVFYELLTGVKPYAADTPVALVLKKVTEPLVRPSDVQAGIPEFVEQVMFKALSKEPEERYPTMQDFCNALEKIGKMEVPGPRPDPFPIPGPVPNSPTNPTECSWVRPKDRMPMILIPAGKAPIGRNDDALDSRPQHIVALDAFLIDKYPVTNRMFPSS